MEKCLLDSEKKTRRLWLGLLNIQLAIDLFFCIADPILNFNVLEELSTSHIAMAIVENSLALVGI